MELYLHTPIAPSWQAERQEFFFHFFSKYFNLATFLGKFIYLFEVGYAPFTHFFWLDE
jgi:hypothetical protein